MLKMNALNENSDINDNKNNTVIYKGKRFLRTASQTNLNKKLISNKFIRKLNIPKAKTVSLKNQAKFALLLNSNNTKNPQIDYRERSKVQIPTVEYNQSLSYLQNKVLGNEADPTALNNFEENVESRMYNY